MTTASPAPPDRVDVSSWSDEASRDALDLLASSVAEMADFEVAAIRVRAYDGQLMCVAVQGDDPTRDALLGSVTPVDVVHRELERAESWGRFQFVPHDDEAEDHLADYAWIPELVPLDAPDAWHPLDLLLAVLRDEAGTVIGTLSIDLPRSGRLPGPVQRGLLERYAVQAERAVRMGIERAELAERLRLAEASRQIVRAATSRLDLAQALEECRRSLLVGYRGDFLVVRTYAQGNLPESGAPPTSLGGAVVDVVRRAVRRCWQEQRVALVAEHLHDDVLFTPDEHRAVVRLFTGYDVGVAMLVPLGSGAECLGHLILGRTDSTDMWSHEEQRAAFDVARDIGQAVSNAENYAREQQLVAELREMSTYKSQLLSTVSHELKNPLGAISGHLELLDEVADVPEEARYSLAAMTRATRRLNRVVDDLLLLAEYEDPDVAVTSAPVELGAIVDEVVELFAVRVQQRNLTVTVERPDQPLEACGQSDELDRVIANLLSNAVKYTPPGRSISIALRRREDEVEVAVTDQGIGISEADQAQLFTEFFRSADHVARAQPGTGLGLAICARIAARHRGRIEVSSVLGEGSTFRLVLPAPPA